MLSLPAEVRGMESLARFLGKTPSRSFLVKTATAIFPVLCELRLFSLIVQCEPRRRFLCCGSLLGHSRLGSILTEVRVPRGRQGASQERIRAPRTALTPVTADTSFSCPCLRLSLGFCFVLFWTDNLNLLFLSVHLSLPLSVYLCAALSRDLGLDFYTIK